MTNEEWSHQILEHRIAISDTIQFTHAEASNTCFDPDRGMFYTVYNASRRCYGESHDIVALAIVPVCQPHKTMTKIVIERGQFPFKQDDFFICANCYYFKTDEVLYNVITHFGQHSDITRGYVRITFSVNGREHYYVDYDIAGDRFSEIKSLKVMFHGEIRHFNGEVMRAYVEEHGFQDFNKRGDSERLILTDKFRLQPDGYRYAMATANWCWPVAIRIKDGSDVVELLGVVPEPAAYEAQSAIADGKMYVLLREAPDKDFWVSDDMGRTFRPVGRFDFISTRQQLCPYKGKMLVAITKPDILPGSPMRGRNNIQLLYGTGEDLSLYQSVFLVTDPHGIVYYDIVEYKGILFMIWSSGDLFPDRNPQAKDLLWFVRLGEI